MNWKNHIFFFASIYPYDSEIYLLIFIQTQNHQTFHFENVLRVHSSFFQLLTCKTCVSTWRKNYFSDGSYINYSQIAARLVRQALKADLRVEAVKRDEANVKFTEWKDGKAISK